MSLYNDIKLTTREPSIYLLSVQQSWLQYCSAQYIGPPCKKKGVKIMMHIPCTCITLKYLHSNELNISEAVKHRLTCVLSEGE